MNPPDIDALWNFGDPAASEDAFRALLNDHTDAPDAWRRCAHTQVARALGLQQKFDAGHATLDALGQLTDPLPATRAALERGRLFNSAGDKDRAKKCFDRALKIIDDTNDADDPTLEHLAIDALHMLAIIAQGDTSIALNTLAVSLSESSKNPRARRWRGSLYNNLGWACHSLTRFEEAADWFARALAFRLEAGKEPGIRVARWAAARVLRDLGHVEDSLDSQRAILADYGEDQVSGHVFEEIGECLLILEKSEEAGPSFARAHAMLSQDPWFVANERERLARLKALSRP